jgi:signal transduction histidine kinase
MKSHEALRREGKNADWSAFRAIRRPAASGRGKAGKNADAARAVGHRRPGGHVQEDKPADRQRGPEPSRRPSRRGLVSLKDWRVRSRLLLLVAVPVLVAVALGVVAVVSSVGTAQSYQQVHQLAVLAGDATDLAQDLQNEREDTVTFISMGVEGGRDALSPGATKNPLYVPPQSELALLASDYHVTAQAAAMVRSVAATIGGSYPAQAQSQAQSAVTAIGDLKALEQAATHTQLPVLTVINDYGTTISQLLTLQDEVAAGSRNASLADDVLVAGLVSSMEEEASQQQAIVTSALPPDQLGETKVSTQTVSVLSQEAAEQSANLADFDLTATAAQRQLFDSALSSPVAATAQQQLDQASSELDSGATSTSDPTVEVAANNTSYITSSQASVEDQLMSSIITQSGSLRDRATTEAVLEGAGVIILLILALMLIAVIGQSMIGPLRRLRTGALEIAGVRLPEAVRLMAETDGEGVSMDVEPINVDSTDEIGEVARAFDQVHQEALRLAANEAALRGNVNAMFVNLSRRTQSLVERQIRLISSLEQGEQDTKRLANLFQMDHLATLMRRNSENLLVLAGQDLSRRWNRPVALVDVLRAALSEIEQYERVTLNVQPGISVRAQAVSDVVHLTAELVENATSFSAAESPVTIVGRLLNSGGVLLEISDQGVGMSADELAHANWRLDNPPVVDVAVSRRMGLFVVARLAARHGIRVRLRPADTGGLVALVWLPDEAITSGEGTAGPGLPRRNRGDADGLAPRSLFGGTEADTAAADGGSTDISSPVVPRFARLHADGILRNSASQLGGPFQPGEPAVAATGPLPSFADAPPLPAEPAVAEPEITAAPPPAVLPRRDTGAAAEPPAVLPRRDSGAAAEPPAVLPRRDTGAAAEPPLSFPWRDTGAAAEPPVGLPWRDTGAAEFQAGSAGADAGAEPGNGAAEPASEPAELPAGSPVFHIRGSARSPSGVIVPPAPDSAEQNRLPIFEAVESDWFRRVQRVVTRHGDGQQIGSAWASPADDGWRAAEVADAPSSDGVTSAGLPKRVPRANLIPGSAGAPVANEPALPSAPVRSAAATRDRFASFQRGVRQGRAAASGTEPDGGQNGRHDEA